jgi:hypothetical protein
MYMKVIQNGTHLTLPKFTLHPGTILSIFQVLFNPYDYPAGVTSRMRKQRQKRFTPLCLSPVRMHVLHMLLPLCNYKTLALPEPRNSAQLSPAGLVGYVCLFM